MTKKEVCARLNLNEFRQSLRYTNITFWANLCFYVQNHGAHLAVSVLHAATTVIPIAKLSYRISLGKHFKLVYACSITEFALSVNGNDKLARVIYLLQVGQQWTLLWTTSAVQYAITPRLQCCQNMPAQQWLVGKTINHVLPTNIPRYVWTAPHAKHYECDYK